MNNRTLLILKLMIIIFTIVAFEKNTKVDSGIPHYLLIEKQATL